MGHDFSGRKKRTFILRVHRGMQINHCDSLRAYGEFLQRDHQESARLFRDLLISVTSFFRDAEAFDALEKIVVPRFFSYGAVSLKEVVRRRSRPISPRAASCLPFETIDHAAAQDCKRWQTLDELPTNAVKYGALSNSPGHVSVDRSLMAAPDDRASTLTLRWREVGPRAADQRKGLWSDAHRTRSELRGETEFSGTFIIPLNRGRIAAWEIMASSTITGKRVLIVEDELIISMMLECELNDSGCEVIGPTPSVEAALRLIDEERLDCALLDYQLGDETSGRIASVLAERNIPFLLMTGHCAGDLPLELRDKTLLRKPVTGKALRAALEAILNIAA